MVYSTSVLQQKDSHERHKIGIKKPNSLNHSEVGLNPLMGTTRLCDLYIKAIASISALVPNHQI